MSDQNQPQFIYLTTQTSEATHCLFYTSKSTENFTRSLADLIQTTNLSSPLLDSLSVCQSHHSNKWRIWYKQLPHEPSPAQDLSVQEAKESPAASAAVLRFRGLLFPHVVETQERRERNQRGKISSKFGKGIEEEKCQANLTEKWCFQNYFQSYP